MMLSYNQAKILLYVLENLRGVGDEVIISRKILIKNAKVNKTELSKMINNRYKFDNYISDLEKKDKRIKNNGYDEIL